MLPFSDGFMMCTHALMSARADGLPSELLTGIPILVQTGVILLGMHANMSTHMGGRML